MVNEWIRRAVRLRFKWTAHAHATRHIERALAAGCVPETKIQNPKTDVMPSACPGPEQVDLFSASVTDYVQAVAPLTHLQQTATYPHPVFGLLTAHGWHCMCGFHLQLHLRQARVVSKQ